MTRARICNSSNFLFAQTKKLMSFKCSFLEQSKLHICDNLFCLLLKGCNQTTYNQRTEVYSPDRFVFQLYLYKQPLNPKP